MIADPRIQTLPQSERQWKMAQADRCTQSKFFWFDVQRLRSQRAGYHMRTPSDLAEEIVSSGLARERLFRFSRGLFQEASRRDIQV